MAKLKISGFKVIKKTISGSNISDFELLSADSVRKARGPKIKQLAKALKAGTIFDAPIVVTKNGKLTVIDGQHRILAIEKCIDEDKTFEVEVMLFQYPAKDTKQQGALFKNWNSGTPQSTDDYIQMFSSTLPFWNKMNQFHFTQNIGSVSIYPTSDELHFRKWVGSYTAAKLNSPGGNSQTNEKFLETVRRLDQQDYNYFFEMTRSIKSNLPSIFERGYRYATTTGIAALVYVYYKTVVMGKLDEADFWKAYHKTVATNDVYYEELKLSGITASVSATKTLLRLLNKGLPQTHQQTITTLM